MAHAVASAACPPRLGGFFSGPGPAPLFLCKARIITAIWAKGFQSHSVLRISPGAAVLRLTESSQDAINATWQQAARRVPRPTAHGAIAGLCWLAWPDDTPQLDPLWAIDPWDHERMLMSAVVQLWDRPQQGAWKPANL